MTHTAAQSPLEPPRDQPPTVVKGFSPLVKENLGWYVYLLRDPRDNQIFYIGKGRRDRAFHHEANATELADHPALQSAKAARILDIARSGSPVTIDVLRHAITSEHQAYEVESAAIDLVNDLYPKTLLNVVLGHHHAQHGLMGADELEILYAAQPAPPVGVPIMLVSLNKLWRPDMTEAELHEITRGWWRAAVAEEQGRVCLRRPQRCRAHHLSTGGLAPATGR